jgi:hypothetical protein
VTLPLSTRVEAFTAALAQARELADAGAVLDLAGLDDAAADICAAASALPAAERRRAAQGLVAIGAGLDALAATLAARVSLEGEDQGSRQTRAERAYRRVAARRAAPGRSEGR